MIERIESLEKRMNFIEEQLGIGQQQSKKRANAPKPEPEPDQPDQTINGFGKEQLRMMFSWARGMKLQQLSKGDFEELKKWDMLWDFFPDAPGNYEEIRL